MAKNVLSTWSFFRERARGDYANKPVGPVVGRPCGRLVIIIIYSDARLLAGARLRRCCRSATLPGRRSGGLPAFRVYCFD